MPNIVMTLRALGAAVIVFSLSASAVLAQRPGRIRGQIEKVDGPMLTIKTRAGQMVTVKFADDARLASLSKTTLADIKPDSYIGVAGIPKPDGSVIAFSIHTLPESARGRGEGERAWDARPGSTMTNAYLASVVKDKDGDEITVKYKGVEKKVTVTPASVIAMQAPADKTALQPGAQVAVMVAVKQADGLLLAKVMYVGRDVTPAM